MPTPEQVQKAASELAIAIRSLRRTVRRFRSNRQTARRQRGKTS